MPITGAQITALKSAVADIKARATALVVDAPVAVDPPVVSNPPPVIGTPPGAQLIHPMKGLTNNIYLDIALGMPWRRETGDWLDKSGTLNGPVPTFDVSGPVVTVDISTVPSDLYIQGADAVSRVVIDGIDIMPSCFWVAAQSNASHAMPSASGNPVIVPNAGGKRLEVTTNAKGRWRIDPIALPTATVPTPDASYYRAPDLLRVNPTSLSAMVIPGSVPAPGCFGGAYSFESVQGVPMALAHCPARYEPIHGNGRVARCDYPVAPHAEMYVAYLLGIGPDVASAVTDKGVKLSGMTGDGGLLNMGEHINVYSLRNPRNGSAMALRDQYYSAEATIGQGAGNEQNSLFSHGFLSSPGITLIEHGAIPNTFKPDGTPNQDGHKLTWINGVLVEDRLIAWFKTPGMLWRWLSMQIYHGGTMSYAKDCYYLVGPYMASTKRIGVDPAFMPLLMAA